MPAGSPELLAAQGEFLYWFEHDYSGALPLFLKARSAMPGNASIIEKLAYTQRRMGQWEEAVNSLAQVTDLDPANVGAAVSAAGSLALMQQWPRLKAYISQHNDRYGGFTEFASITATLPLWSEGDVNSVRDRLSNIPPKASENYFLLATELPWYERDFAGGIEVWGRPEIREFAWLSGFTGFENLQLAMTHHFFGDIESANERLDQAVEQLSNIDRARPSLFIAFDLETLAQILAVRGEKSASIAAAEEATQLVTVADDDLTARWLRLTLSWVLAKSGEFDRALEVLAGIIDQTGGARRWELYLDPRWDFFRVDERFNELIRPHNLEQPADE